LKLIGELEIKQKVGKRKELGMKGVGNEGSWERRELELGNEWNNLFIWVYFFFFFKKKNHDKFSDLEVAHVFFKNFSSLADSMLDKDYQRHINAIN